jgi:hypothetical protein
LKPRLICHGWDYTALGILTESMFAKHSQHKTVFWINTKLSGNGDKELECMASPGSGFRGKPYQTL